MRARLRRWRSTIVVVFALSLSLSGFSGVAWAAQEVPRATVSAVDFYQGTVSVAAYGDSATTEVGLTIASVELTRVPTVTPARKVVFPSYRLKSAVTAEITGYGVGGVPIWSRTLVLDPAAFRPRGPVVNAPSGTIVGSTWSLTGDAGRPYSYVRARVRETWESTSATRAAGVDGHFEFSDIRIPRGPATIDIIARNAFGTSPTGTIRVYYPGGNLPSESRYVLVDKAVLWMYHVRDGRVQHAWPIAIGTPRTPTPSGYFRIGPRQAGGGDWGVLRRRLYRVSNGRLYGTNYYIHGTNAPWTIGMEASLGCVRMYNSHVLQFTDVVPNYTLVRIR